MLQGALRAAGALLAVLLAAYSLYLAFTSNFNLGNLLVWVLSAVLCAYVVFCAPVNRWLTGTAAGHITLWVLGLGGAVYAALLAFVAFSGHANTAAGTEKALIVLGAGLRGDKPSLVLRCRLDAAYDYAVQNPGAVIVTTGGQGRDEWVPEGQAMRDYLIAKGLAPERVLAECRSTSTEENFAFARRLMQENGMDTDIPIAYATNAFHCYRAGRYARMAGFAEARALPARTPPQSVLPCYLREALAVAYYWVFRRVDGGPLQGMVGLMSLQKHFFYKG